MNDKKKSKISSMGLLCMYIVISIVVGIVYGIVSSTSDYIVICLNAVTTSLVFWTIVKFFYIVDKPSIERFLKNAVIILTFLCVGLVITKSIDGYNKIYSNLFTLHVAADLVEDEYKEDPEHFEGTGFVEGCKSWEDIREAEKNTLNDWIAHYFITPIVPTCVYLLASITTLNAFPIITFLVAEMKNNEKNTMKD